jgi:DNA mismatch endonuclease (patch repair protein)
MSKVRQSGTKPELSVRKLLHSCGYRFRVKAKDLPGSPDIVNRSARWAIFVHGCFWHAHENCRLWTIPKNNKEFWTKKFSDNRERDKRKIKELKRMGYSVLTFWQCDLDSEAKAKRKILKFIENVRHNSFRKELNIHGNSSQ